MKFQINLDSNEITGYQLDYPCLEANGALRGEDRLRINGLYREKSLKYWIVFFDFQYERDYRGIVGDIIKAGKRYRIDTRDPLAAKMIPRNADSKEIHHLVKKYCGDKYEKLQLIFFICTRKQKSFFYKDLKKFYQRKGYVTQFLTSYNNRKNNMSKYSNMLL